MQREYLSGIQPPNNILYASLRVLVVHIVVRGDGVVDRALCGLSALSDV